MSEPIFVFGANEAGIHGAGAALFARQHHGAEIGKIGHVGNSYGIPTKDGKLRPLWIGDIAKYVLEFVNYARRNPDMRFQVTRIGCGLAGFKPCQIGPLFEFAPPNCELPPGWREGDYR